jgi:hypothetical protein
VSFSFPATGVAGNRGADFVKCLAPSRRPRRTTPLPPTALVGCPQASLLPSAVLAGQRRDYTNKLESEAKMGIFDKIFKRPHKKDPAEENDSQSTTSSDTPSTTDMKSGIISDSSKTNCRNCGAMILHSTFVENSGLCAPCAKGSDAAARRNQNKESQDTRQSQTIDRQHLVEEREKAGRNFGISQQKKIRTSMAGSPMQVQICVIQELKRNELWLVGDQFIPTERIASHIAKSKNLIGTIHSESANKSFDGTPLEIEAFVAMFALMNMKSELGNIEYQILNYGNRGELYVCPQCGAVMKKNLGTLNLAKSGSQITGNTGCATCGVSFSVGAVYQGQYDL